jgi:hypothetical protein
MGSLLGHGQLEESGVGECDCRKLFSMAIWLGCKGSISGQRGGVALPEEPESLFIQPQKRC